MRRYYPENMKSDEHLVGISTTFDGLLIWVSNYGRCGLVSMDFKY